MAEMGEAAEAKAVSLRNMKAEYDDPGQKLLCTMMAGLLLLCIYDKRRHAVARLLTVIRYDAKRAQKNADTAQLRCIR